MAAANPERFRVVQDLPFRGILFAVAHVAGTKRLYVGASDFGVHEVDLSTPKTPPRLLGKHDSYVTGLALAGQSLVSGGYDGRLIWWDAETHTKIRSVNAHRKWVRRVIVTPDARTIASAADDMICRLWDADTGKQRCELRGHKVETPHHYPSMLHACSFSADGKLLATADKVGHVVVWDVVTGKQKAAVEAPGMYTWDPVQRIHSIGGVRSLAFSPDSSRLAVGGMGKVGNIDHLEGRARVEVFDWQTGKRTHEFVVAKFNGLVERLAFHPDGAWLLGAGGANDGFVLFFDLKANKVLRQEKAAMHVHDFALGEGAGSFYAVGHNRISVFAAAAG
jgi:WD40 repeat protein